jgi:hypothetical protein
MEVPPLAAQASKPGLEIAPAPSIRAPNCSRNTRTPVDHHGAGAVDPTGPFPEEAVAVDRRAVDGRYAADAMRRGLALTSVPIAIVRPMHPIAGTPIGSLPAPEPDARRAQHADAEPRR